MRTTGAIYLDFDDAQRKGMKLIRTQENPITGLMIVAGINLGLRISDLLTLTFDELRNDAVILLEKKTKKKRRLVINDNIRMAMQYFPEDRFNGNFHAFRSQKGTVFSTQHVNRLMKRYFKLTGVSSHSLRKTFGRRVWDNDNQSERALIYLNEIFSHHKLSDTRRYLGIKQEELDNVYINL